MAEQLAKPFGVTSWQLVMPGLPDDLVASEAIRKLVEAYIDATQEGREFLDAAAKRERKQKDLTRGNPVGIATSRARNRPESDDETDIKTSRRT